MVPKQLREMLASPGRPAAERVMKAMLEMTKLDVRELRAAYDGRTVTTGA